MGISPYNLTTGSKQEVYWICKNKQGHKHSWLASPDRKIGNNTGCTYCTNKELLSGFNDLRTRHPEIAKDWDEQRNGFPATQATVGSHFYANWKCHKCCGEWKTFVYHRTRNKSGCPYCANKKLLTGFNDLKTKFPEVAKDWDEDANGFPSNQILFRSHYHAFWKCHDCQGTWKTHVYHRTRNDSGCPYHSNRKLLKGFNDLETKFPQIALDWDFCANKLSATDVVCTSSLSANWKCSVCQHKWKTKVITRTLAKTGCPKCNKGESKVARILKDYCLKEYPDSILEYKTLKNPNTSYWLPYDIYIPRFKLFIEVQGEQHYEKHKFYHATHNDFKRRKEIDALKKRFAEDNGLFLEIDIREFPKNALEQVILVFEDFLQRRNLQ